MTNIGEFDEDNYGYEEDIDFNPTDSLGEFVDDLLESQERDLRGTTIGILDDLGYSYEPDTENSTIVKRHTAAVFERIVKLNFAEGGIMPMDRLDRNVLEFLDRDAGLANCEHGTYQLNDEGVQYARAVAIEASITDPYHAASFHIDYET